MAAERAYLSVVSWPGGWTPDRCVEAVVGATGMDPGQTRLAVARGLPQVFQLIDASIADDVVAMLQGDGVLALAPTESDIRAAPKPEGVKRFHVFEGGGSVAVEFWRAESEVVQTADIGLIVRGTIKKAEKRARPALDSSPLEYSADPYGIGGHVDLSDGIAGSTTRMSMIELLDVHLAGGRTLRVDADKMSFDVLGESRGQADRVNMGKLATLLSSLAPRAPLDERFGRFVVRGGLVRPPGSTPRTLEFDFYSAWCAAVNRVLGRL